jgi:glycosyltransferase involved in cell wall biosynthesis
MIVENMYPRDSRVRKEANTLVNEGYDVSVIALRGDGEPHRETVDGVSVFRIPKLEMFRKTVSKKGADSKKNTSLVGAITGYFSEHIYFTTMSFIFSLYIWMKYGLDIIHVHNPPDTLVFIGAFYKGFKKKYIFDHHDLSPELYKIRCRAKSDVVYRSLMLLEKFSCVLADCVIATNESYKDIESQRHNISPNKIKIVRNDPIEDESNGYRSDCTATDKHKRQLLFVGSINPQDGVDILLEALHILVYEILERNFVCNILGDGDSLADLRRVSEKLGLDDYVDFKGYVNDRELVWEFLCKADIGVEPAPDNELNRNSTFIKVMEYMAAGKPVVAFDLRETRYSLDGGGVLVSDCTREDFARAVKRTLDDLGLRERLGKVGRARVKKDLNWAVASSNLLKAYSCLCNEAPSRES